jgi:spoIIIJ-associated protein
MLDQNDLQKIKETVFKFFQTATVEPLKVDAKISAESENKKNELEDGADAKELVELDVKLSEPQILIGEKGQTLFEVQRILKIILNKKLQKIFYLNLDINDYKKKKTEYLKDIAKDLANEVAITKSEKVLMPMSAYERRIIHAELAQRQDVVTESRGDGLDRYVVIKPR